MIVGENSDRITLKEVESNLISESLSEPVPTSVASDSESQEPTVIKNILNKLGILPIPTPITSSEPVEIADTEPASTSDCKSLEMTDLEIQLYAMDLFFEYRKVGETALQTIMVLMKAYSQTNIDLTTNSDGSINFEQKIRVSNILKNTNMPELVEEHGTPAQKAEKGINEFIWKFRETLRKFRVVIIILVIIFVIMIIFMVYNYLKSYGQAKAFSKMGNIPVVKMLK